MRDKYWNDRMCFHKKPLSVMEDKRINKGIGSFNLLQLNNRSDILKWIFLEINRTKFSLLNKLHNF